MTARAELLLVLGLPPQASANEIELVYLESRAEAEKRLQQGDKRAEFVIERLEGAFKHLEGMSADVNAEDSQAAPVAGANGPFLQRSAGSAREANGALICGIAACLVVLLIFYVYWPELTGEASIYVLSLPQSPVYILVFLLAFAAEVLSHTSLRDASRARFLTRQGLDPSDWLDHGEISRARTGRYLGRIAVALAILLAILLASSFGHFIAE